MFGRCTVEYIPGAETPTCDADILGRLARCCGLVVSAVSGGGGAGVGGRGGKEP